MSGLVYLFLCFGNVKDACEEQKERKKTGRQRRSASPEVRKRPQVETEVEDDRNQNRYEADGLSDEEEDDGEKDYDPRKKVYVSSDED